ncbi:Reverse transcriptase [Theobroma cacao]|nr:Reverse transcriptase [Theobroma cacao]
MQVLNLWKEFEVLRMKDEESIKDYNDKVMKIVNQLRLLDEELNEMRIVNKILLGHVEKVCKTKANHQDEKAAVVEHKKETEEVLFMANIFEVSKKNEIWFIDSACSNHITGNNNIFANLGRNFKSQVEIGNGEFLKICGRGTVEVETVKGMKKIPNVFYSPKVSYNLLNVGQLLEEHYSLVFADNLCTVFDPSENKRWNWISKEIELSNDLRIVDDSETAPAELINEEYVDHLPVRGTKSLQEIYQRCHVAMIEPSSFDEAFKSDNWRKAMQIELEMIKKNKTWQLVQRPTYHKVIGVKWIFRTKVNPDGTVNKLNAQLVVKAFLNGILEEDVYIEQPQGFIEPEKEDMVYKLNKALYGLKQASRAWKYAFNLLKKFRMNECKPASTPLAANLQLTKKDGSGAADATYYKSIIGSLLYLTASRPEIMFSASLMSKFMQSPTMNHLSTTKRILRYIKGSIDYGIKFPKTSSSELRGYADSD